MKKIIKNIKEELLILENQTNEELSLKTEKLKKRSTKEPLDNLIPEWFALVQEISSRTIGLKHFDTQLMAGLLLHPPPSDHYLHLREKLEYIAVLGLHMP
jgi:preprotein translocase subunit SecA